MAKQEVQGTIAERLKAHGVRGVLVDMARNGQILALRCEMPTCYSPNGRRHFEDRPKTTPLPDWAPNADHYPRLKMDDGHLDPWNVRLAHVYCNNLDVGWRSRIRAMLQKEPTRSFESIAEALSKKKNVHMPFDEESWTAELVRKVYVS